DRTGLGAPCGAGRRRRARDRRGRGVVGRERGRRRPRARPVLHGDDTRHDQPRRARRAVTGAVVPVVYALASGERPGPTAVVGIALAVAAIALVSLAPDDTPATASAGLGALPLAFAAGLLFGLFYVCLACVHEDAG